MTKRLLDTRLKKLEKTKALATRLKVDPTTLARWERGERKPVGEIVACVESFLADDIQPIAQGTNGT